MIRDDVLVFDGVAHPFNFESGNYLGSAGELFANHLYAFHTVPTSEKEPKLPAHEFLRDWKPEDISTMVYEESDTDMLVSMPLPLTNRDGLSPWKKCAELAREDPERTTLWGTVNPLEGKRALDSMEVQVKQGHQVLQRPLRPGGPDLSPQVGDWRPSGLRDPAEPRRRLRLPATHRTSQAQDSRGEPAPAPRHGRGRNAPGSGVPGRDFRYHCCRSAGRVRRVL